jgi:hypothetical protein
MIMQLSLQARTTQVYGSLQQRIVMEKKHLCEEFTTVGSYGATAELPVQQSPV